MLSPSSLYEIKVPKIKMHIAQILINQFPMKECDKKFYFNIHANSAEDRTTNLIEDLNLIHVKVEINAGSANNTNRKHSLVRMI